MLDFVIGLILIHVLRSLVHSNMLNGPSNNRTGYETHAKAQEQNQ